MPQKKTVLPKKPPQTQQPAQVADSQPQYPAAQPPVVNRPAPVYQVANPAQQQQPQQQQQQQPQGNNGGGPETDVQRQLRLLYQKS